MTLILTFLGKGGTGRTTVAIAAACQMAQGGRRVLLMAQGSNPTLSRLLDIPLSNTPQITPQGFSAVQIRTTLLLEDGWELLKRGEGEVMRTPILQSIFGQELPVLPGMDSALVLDALRRYATQEQYDVVIYDGSGDQHTLRMLALPENFSWYVRKFRQVFIDSDLGKTVLPFLQPLAATILSADWSPDRLTQPGSQFNAMLEKGRAALQDPTQMAAYLVTTKEHSAIATAKHLWGCAQQIGLTVGGVLCNDFLADPPDFSTDEFAPLTTSILPTVPAQDRLTLAAALPALDQAHHAPRPLVIDRLARQIKFFLPGFDKKQVKLSQNGSEVTVEAGDLRRNLLLPTEWSDRAITGARFQEQYLVVSF